MRSTGVQLCRMVVKVDDCLRQKFWHGEHWIAPETDLADADLVCFDLDTTNLFGANLNWIRGKIDLEPVFSQVSGLIAHLSD